MSGSDQKQEDGVVKCGRCNGAGRYYEMPIIYRHRSTKEPENGQD